MKLANTSSFDKLRNQARQLMHDLQYEEQGFKYRLFYIPVATPTKIHQRMDIKNVYSILKKRLNTKLSKLLFLLSHRIFHLKNLH